MNAADLRPRNTREPADKPRPSPRRKLLYASIIVLLWLLLAETGAQVALRVAYGPRLNEAELLHEYDAELGWVNMKNRRALDRYGTDKHATHNLSGLRATREYTAAVPAGRYRIIFLGDSFTYGVDVGDGGTFVAQLESLASSIETVNMGVAGYGIDQMYLLYEREQARYAADLLVLAFIEDDVRRMKLSAFLTQNPKPRLLLSGNTLSVANVPVPTWGVSARTGWLEEFPNRTALVQVLRSLREMLFQDYDPFPVAERILDDLNALSRERKQRFAVVYLPARTDLASDRRTDAARRFQEFAARADVPFVDLTDKLKVALKQQNVPVFVANGGHYSEAGYKLVAESLLSDLRKELPGVPR